MINRLITISIATIFTALVIGSVLSVMALDLLGASFFEKLKFLVSQRGGTAVAKELEGTKNITFFKSVEVAGRPFQVTMGISFETPKALAAKQQQRRWCYVMIKPTGGGIARQIELATQEGTNPPRYAPLSGYSASELAALGETQASLEAVARKYCVFAKESRSKGARGERYATIVLKGQPA